jgi:hypothetical protein
MHTEGLWHRLGSGIPVVALACLGFWLGIPAAVAGDEAGEREQARIRRGFEIAPVPLNLRGKNRALVGLGSYFVNAAGSCNMCHSAGTSTEFAPGGNPYFKNQSVPVVNQATYLGGGRTFAAQVSGATPPIVSRNLTPDRTGRPVGGHTWPEFLYIIRTGADLDHVHPNCADLTVTASSTCYPAKFPYDGDLLQVMPWPSLRNLTDHELRAIYEYLGTVPCVAGPSTGVLHNDCT